jgi:hypothetical protein
MSEDYFAGLFTGVCYAAPVLVGLLWLFRRGITPRARAERIWRDDLERREAEYLSLGFHPQEAYTRARRDQDREAQATDEVPLAAPASVPENLTDE